MLIVTTIVEIVQLTLTVLFLFLFLRAILSWFPMNDDAWFIRFVYTITEPIIIPFRALADHIPLFQGLPVDVGQLFAFLAVLIVQTILEFFPIVF